MFGTLKTLIIGANARAEEKVRDTYSIEKLIVSMGEVLSIKTANRSVAKIALERSDDDPKGGFRI